MLRESKSAFGGKKVLIFLLVLFCFSDLEARQMKIRVETPKGSEAKTALLKQGLDIVHIEAGYLDLFVNETEYQQLLNQGFKIEVIIPDLNVYLQEKMGKQGDFGPYYTYTEMTAKLDSLYNQYPDLLTEKISIGKSWQQRDIWAVKVSVNPEQEEAEAKVLYTGVTHAREPIGATICLEFIRYLCEQYSANNPEAVYILENTELWFIPVVNPDGYVKNEPNGGWWRKNCRPDSSGAIVGVDLNRNYSYQWGYDDIGSSPYPGSECYRGPSAASEPEVQAIVQFCQTKQFQAAIDYHSYGNLILFPWGYTRLHTPDSLFYQEMGDSIKAVNHYAAGTVWELLYLANGGSNDWHYGAYHTYGIVLEVGEDFWQPDTADINQQVWENLYANLYFARTAIKLFGVEEETIGQRELVKVFPNPGRNLISFEVRSTKTITAPLSIYDLSGRKITTIAGKQERAGVYTYSWSANSQISGVYFCRIQIDGKVLTKKIVILK